AGPVIYFPQVSIPKLRWPGVSPRARALLVIGILCSPAYLSDAIGYCVMRMGLTAEQIAEKRAPGEAMLKHIEIFRVACVDPDAPAAEAGRWAKYAAQNNWPLYPQAGPTCFKPDRGLLGVIGLKTFSVACPTIAFSAPDKRRWVAYAASHGWTDYSQAGEGCVDP